MTKGETVLNAAVAGAVAAIVASTIMTQVPWPAWAPSAVLIAGVLASFVLAGPDDRKARRSTWVAPASAVLIAAQLVYTADAADRVRTSLLAGLLVVATLVVRPRRSDG